MTSSTVFVPDWEYVNRHVDLKKSLGHYPRIDAEGWTQKAWDEAEKLAFSLIQSDLQQGWQVDQAAWGSQCFSYKQLAIGIWGWTVGDWIGYIILGCISFFILFFVLPFTMTHKYLELQSFDVRLRRLPR